MDKVRLDELKDQYLLCRTIQHAWDEQPASHLQKPEYNSWWLFLRCMRCGTERTDLIDSTGERLTRKYNYPEHYKLDEKASLTEMRLEWHQRNYYSNNTRKRTKKQ